MRQRTRGAHGRAPTRRKAKIKRRLPRGKERRETARGRRMGKRQNRLWKVISFLNGFRNTEQAEGGRRRC